MRTSPLEEGQILVYYCKYCCKDSKVLEAKSACLKQCPVIANCKY